MRKHPTICRAFRLALPDPSRFRHRFVRFTWRDCRPRAVTSSLRIMGSMPASAAGLLLQQHPNAGLRSPLAEDIAGAGIIHLSSPTLNNLVDSAVTSIHRGGHQNRGLEFTCRDDELPPTGAWHRACREAPSRIPFREGVTLDGVWVVATRLFTVLDHLERLQMRLKTEGCGTLKSSGLAEAAIASMARPCQSVRLAKAASGRNGTGFAGTA